MRRSLLLVFLLVPAFSGAQSYFWNSDSARSQEPNYLMDKYQDLLRYHDPIMYLSFPYVESAGERPVPLEEGEGKNGYFLEGNFSYRFIITRGKYYSAPLIQRMRLTLDAGTTVRLTNDFSSPLLPMSARFGLGLDYLLTNLDDLKKSKSTIAWTTIQLHHYSNGQSDSFFISGPVQRNNYKGGDFSTNYLRGMLNVAFNSDWGSTTASAGYQNELDLVAPLLLSKELAGYYGLKRLLFGLQWIQTPFVSEMSFRNRSTESDIDRVVVQKRRQIMLRAEMEYILDDLSKWTSSDLQRWSAHLYATYMPSLTNEVGFMAHLFYGRDYLNIRFDDVVFLGELGVYLKFNKR